MRFLACLILLFFAREAQASSYDTLENAKITKKFIKYIPTGYSVIDSVCGDINNDNLVDVILVLDSINIYDKYDSHDRAILILQKTKTGYIKNAFCLRAVLCSQCGGVFGDPYSGIELSKNILKINHYGGSAWRWSFEHTFRYQNNEWYLIGETYSSYWTVAECEEVGKGAFCMEDKNYNTCRVHTVKTKENECNPYIDVWSSFKKKPLMLFKNFKQE